MIVNRKIKFDYDIVSSWECGIVLYGSEVKVIRQGSGSIVNSYAMIQDGEVMLLNMNLPKYRYSLLNHDELRPRKLLLKRKEINKLIKSKEKHYTLIPSAVYINKRGYVKVTLCLCVGKTKFDKRRSIKEKEQRLAAQRVSIN